MYRSAWLDVARGGGIILVVFGHIWRGLHSGNLVGDGQIFETIDKAIYLFHMPLFFFRSGMVFQSSIERKGIRGSFMARFETLLYPLVLWSYVTAFFLLIAGSMTNRPPMPLGELLVYPFPPRDIFWFIWALFFIQTIASLVASVRTDLLIFYSICCVVLVAVTTLAPLDGLLQPAVWNLPYFLGGLLVSRFQGLRAPSAKSSKAAIPAVVVAVIAAEVWIYIYPSTFRDFSGFIASGIATAGVCYVTAQLTPRLPKRLSAGLEFLGRISMAIFLMHVFFFAAVRIVLVKVGVQSIFIHVSAGLLAGLFGPIVFYLIARRLRLLRILALGRDGTARRTMAYSPA
ncbi:MAG: acyltransferase [Rhizobium sp.]|nr:acyltransferase [Rhizobium sp.]